MQFSTRSSDIWRRGVVLLVGAGALVACPRVEPPEAQRWTLAGRAETVESVRGMVVSDHPLASQVGADVLARGGNAVDAAVAVGFALAVVLPRAGNLGGGGFLVYRAADGEVRTLDYRETAPAGANRDMFVDAAGEPTELSVIGALAAGVPGSVAGLAEMHRELGSLPWTELVEPAIELAYGHVVDEVRHDEIAGAAADLGLFPASVTQFLPGGEPPPAGAVWSQPDLARTLERIVDEGSSGFYRGAVAALIVAEMARSGGIITAADLADYRPRWREPLASTYRAHTFFSMPPPSSGGVTLAEICNILEGYVPLPAFGSAELVALESEAMRRAFLDRNRHLGDPDFVAMPLERLLAKEHAARWRATIVPRQATPTALVEGTLESGGETTHYSIVDAAGAVASVTTTLNFSFGGKVTVSGAGFLLNNEMDDFAVAPGRANEYGLVQGEPNAVAPGRRMLSSMTPTIVLDPTGELRLVLGSPGGPTIITTVFQVLSNVVDHDMTLAAAVEAPRIHHQALPDVVFYEPGGIAPEVAATLAAWGYELRERDALSGSATAIARVGASWQGVADPRRGGGAATPSSLPASAVAMLSAGVAGAQSSSTASPR